MISIEVIQQGLREMFMASKLLEVDNCDFYKRSIARIIALRTHNFLYDQLMYEYNNSTINTEKQKVRGDLNTLKGYYDEYFKEPRHKFAGHFEDADFGERIELWSSIDFEKADFFFTQPLSIYEYFSNETDYLVTEDLKINLTDNIENLVKDVNTKYNIEDKPRFASDLLSLTRFNTGGMLYCSIMQQKAATLKSLLLILDYEFALYSACVNSIEYSDLIKKIIVIDIINYCDNLYTRTDLLAGAPQEMNGLDNLIDSVKQKEAKKILDDFKMNFKFNETVLKLRDIRNKIGSHIAKDISIVDQKAILDSVTIDELKEFYTKIKNVFEQMCREEFTLKLFMLDPDVAHGIVGFSHQPEKTFNKGETPQIEFDHQDTNDLQAIEENYEEWVNGSDYAEIRSFFWDAFINGEEHSKINIEIKVSKHQTKGENLFITKAHNFLSDKLKSDDVNKGDKIAIMNLFTDCATGHPAILVYILKDAYTYFEGDLDLQLNCIVSMGRLSSVLDFELLELIKDAYSNENFIWAYNCIYACLNIDFRNRNIGYSIEIDTNENEFSQFIKESILTLPISHRIIAIAGLASETFYSHRLGYNFAKLKELYFDWFAESFSKALDDLIDTLKLEVDSDSIKNSKQAFISCRFVTAIAIIGEVLENNNHETLARMVNSSVAQILVKFSLEDINSIKNFGVVLNKLGDTPRAIEVFKSIVKRKPSDYSNYIPLLQLLKEDNQNEEFEMTREYVLSNYNIDDDSKTIINSI